MLTSRLTPRGAAAAKAAISGEARKSISALVSCSVRRVSTTGSAAASVAGIAALSASRGVAAEASSATVSAPFFAAFFAAFA